MRHSSLAPARALGSPPMVCICIGPVCVPMSAFMPFLIGVLHQYGLLKWVREEWFTWRWLGPRVRRLVPGMKVTQEEFDRTAVKPRPCCAEETKKAA